MSNPDAFGRARLSKSERAELMSQFGCSKDCPLSIRGRRGTDGKWADLTGSHNGQSFSVGTFVGDADAVAAIIKYDILHRKPSLSSSGGEDGQ